MSRKTSMWAAALVAVAAVATYSVVTSDRAAAATVTQPTSVTYLNDQVLAPGASATASLTTVPANAVSATFEISGRWAWKPTKLSICPGAVTAACKAAPALITPVQTRGVATVTVPLASAAGKVVVYNSAASVRVTLKLTAYTVPTIAASTTYVDNTVLAPKASKTVNISGLPTNVATATFLVSGKFAWRPTKISVCAGATASAACIAAPALVTPTQSLGTAVVTLDMSKANRQVTLYNSTASVRTWLVLTGYSTSAATTAPKPTATATPTATPKPTATPTATATPKPSATPTPTPTPKPTATPTPTPKPTPTPTPTPKPTPTPTPTPAPPAAPAPAPSGRPGATNTGVPSGTKLTVHQGTLTVTTPGAVIDSVDIHGWLQINAAGVVVKNSIVRGLPTEYDKGLVMLGAGASVTIQDSELAPTTPSYHVRGIIGSNFTLNRVNIHHVIDQVLITGDNVTVQNSWLHDNLYYAQDPNYNNTPSHNDNIQISIGKKLRFTNNTMTGTKNAVMMVTQDRGTVTDLVFSGNYADGGACSVNLAEKSYGPLKGLTFKDNVFGRNTKVADCAIIAPATTAPLLALSNNVYTDGKVVVVHKG